MLLLLSQQSKFLALNKRTNFEGIYLATLSADSSGITVQQRRAPYGGIGNLNFKVPTSANPAVSLTSSSITSEGAASACFTFSASVSSMTFDDTVRSIDVSYAIAGTGAWHPWVPCSYAPSDGSVSGVVHGLAAGQAYDVALQPRGVNGDPVGSPLVLGTSPTVSQDAISATILGYNEFSSDAVLQSNGEYKLTGDVNVGGFPATLQTGAWLWCEWYARFPNGPAGNGWGPIFAGASPNPINGYFANFYSGGGAYGYYDAAGVTHNVAGLAANTANDNNYHHFRAGLNYIGLGNAPGSYKYRFIVFCDDTTTPSVDYTDAYSLLSPAAIYPGFISDPNTTVYLGRMPLVSRGASPGPTPTSTSMRVMLPNSTAYLPEFSLQYSVTVSGGNATVKYWHDNGSGGDVLFLMPDGTQYNAGHTTSASPDGTFGPVTAGSNVYILAFWSNQTNQWTVTLSTTSFSATQVAAAYADGGFVAAVATVNTGSGTYIPTSSSGTGGIKGNGGRALL